MHFVPIADINKKHRVADIAFEFADNTYDRFLEAEVLADDTLVRLPQTVNFC